jgi:rhomboid family GlyGly-CTERM serine protease
VEAASGVRRPLLTLGLVAASAAVALLPGAEAALVLERAAFERGEWWRGLTGHLVHVFPRLALVDLVVLLGLGAWLEGRSRGLLAATLLASALAASAGVLLASGFSTYVGSSALACGVLGALAIREERARPRVLARLLCALFVLKLALEALGVRPLVSGGLPAGVEPAVVAHLAGALAGLALGLAARAQARRRLASPSGSRLKTCSVSVSLPPQIGTLRPTRAKPS